MRQNKILFLGMLVFSIMLFSIIGVSALEVANVTIITPEDAGSMTGVAYEINCSLDTGFEDENYTTSYFYLGSSSLTAKIDSQL